MIAIARTIFLVCLGLALGAFVGAIAALFLGLVQIGC